MQWTRYDDPEHAQLLASPSWSRCEALIKEFEVAWQSGLAPAIVDFLRIEGPARQALLVELLHVDLEFRLRSGEAIRLESYFKAHPELNEQRRAMLDLIAAEWELRKRHERHVDWNEYLRRFPQFLPELAALRQHVQEQDETPTSPGGLALPLAAGRMRDRPALPGFEILEEIGRGGMGIVYKAREPSLGRNVALKILPAGFTRDPDRLQRFLREARTASGLNHPHICTIHALGEHQGCPFIVMEFIEGITLRNSSARGLSLQEAARLIAQAARALAAAHAAGVVHRDIKPENIMVRADGYVKVLDFGLARRLPQLLQPAASTEAHATRGDGREEDTDPGAILGTVAYMSPEQAHGSAVEAASDIFSLGIVLYELTAWRHPFEGESHLGILYAIANHQPVPPSRWNLEIPGSLEGLILAMLHKDARLRPTALEVEATLEAIADATPRAVSSAAPRAIVHRDLELAALRRAFERAEAGDGTLFCLAGEPGIGKTTLVEDFLAELKNRPCLIARGHCSERLGDTEAYLPVVDALEDLSYGPAKGSITRLMQVVAPSWRAQLQARGATAHLSPEEREAAVAQSPRALSQNAMMREFRTLLQEASRLEPIVLFLDDMHWADVSTVDLLAHLGRHCRGLRVLVIVTYRPTELLLGPHPFHGVAQELRAKGTCTELQLGFLQRPDIDRYLALAFPNHAFAPEFGDLVYARTEGSPLFMVDLLRYLRERGVIAELNGRWALARELPDLRQEFPESVRSMIQRKLERLSEAERRLLAAASVQGPEFDSATVAGALNGDQADIEELLQKLDRVHGLVRPVREHEFPDRRLTLRYAFVHILYQQALYVNLPPARRSALSLGLARTLQHHHGADNADAAAELGCLYEVGRDFEQAARQFWLAAQNAARVFAHREAIVLARRGLRLLESMPASPERNALELTLQTMLGLQLQVIQGFAAPEAKQAYTRAHDLCQQAGTMPQFPVLWGLWLFSKVRSELPRAQEMAEKLLTLAWQQSEPDLALQAHQALGVTALCRGVPAAALRHVEQATALYDPRRHRTHSFQFGQDPGVICKAFGAVALWLLGYPDQAEQQSEEAIRMSRALSPSSQAVAWYFAAMLHQLRRDGPRARVQAEALCAIAIEHGFSFWLAGGTVLRGWALAVCGEAETGLETLRRGLREWLGTDSVTYHTYYLGLLAEVLGAQGQFPQAQRILEEALALTRQTGEALVEPELYRLRGEIALGASAAVERAFEDFQHALEMARRQQAKSLELRAAMSLARLQRRAGKREEACGLLEATLAWFGEGFATADLREARALLAELTAANG
ncbi:MAG: protein kinase [Gemmataceae bacterium]|nr:protein kinase [Gemmataceae bacterium]